MKLFLAGICVGQTTQLLFAPLKKKEDMTLYFAGEHDIKNGLSRLTGGGWRNLCVLESFYYARQNRYFEELYRNGVDILIDSGAFTFMSGTGENIDWDRYTEEYAAFINKYDITKFFELDIDSIVGIKEVERLRAKLEQLTEKQCIPVWHVSRGLDYYKRMVQKYSYVAIGGYVARDVPRQKLEAAFPFLIQEAHKAKCKVHGLGYTPLDIAKRKFRFDSVDSTSWIAGNRFGAIYHFNPATGIMEKYDRPTGKRVKNLATAWNNFNEWVKFQQYLRTI